jgi:hypothetical protein
VWYVPHFYIYSIYLVAGSCGREAVQFFFSSFVHAFIFIGRRLLCDTFHTFIFIRLTYWQCFSLVWDWHAGLEVVKISFFFSSTLSFLFVRLCPFLSTLSYLFVRLCPFSSTLSYLFVRLCPFSFNLLYFLKVLYVIYNFLGVLRCSLFFSVRKN